MNRHHVHALASLCLLALLSACASAPKRVDTPRPAEPVASKPQTPAPASAEAKTSPYAPAQEDPSKRGDYVAGGLYAPHIKDSIPEYVPDVEAIPEPEVKPEPRSRYGNRSYAVLGKRYQVMDKAEGYVEEGTASYYGKKFHGRRTSNQEVYDMYAFTAAHKSLPLPSFVRVTNLDNGKSVVVRVNDRGPFHAGRVIDLSYAAAVKLDFVRKGVARVEVRALTSDQAERPGEHRRPATADTSPNPEATPPTAAPNALSAEEFERWMQSRGVRFASGGDAASEQPPAARADDVPAQAGAILQVAAFSSAENAERARSRLLAEGLTDAHIVTGDAAGRQVWRLRVGPIDGAQVEAVTARLVALGFDAVRGVRD